MEHGGLFEDLPRGTDGRAIIADPRNDENLMIAGLQVAFVLFHNRVVDRLRDDGEDRRLAAALFAEGGFKLRERGDDDRRRAVFLEARRLVTWHYHWIIVNEFLPQIIGRSLVNDILSHGPTVLHSAAGPAEHSGGVPGRRVSLRTQPGEAVVPRESRRRRRPSVLRFIFDPAGEGQRDPVDLRGGTRAPRRFIGWQTFFDFGGDQSRERAAAQDHRHEDIEPAVQSTAWGDCERD